MFHTEDQKMSLLARFARIVFPKYRFTHPQIDWWENAAFTKYLSKFGEDKKFNTARRWIMGQLMRLTDTVAGDTAECGSFKGCSSWLILKNNDMSSHNRMHHIFDSFEGLSEPKAEDGGYWSPGTFIIGEDVVKNNLETGNYKLYKGWIPERFPEIKDRKFSFVHVDVDLYDPTKDSMEFFYDRLNPGGVLLCDDYGCSTCPGATKAVDEFLEDKPEKMMALSCGGGFFIKGIQTSRSAM